MEKVTIAELKGVWVNEIGSTLQILQVEADGSFKGVYKTLVGKTEEGKEFGVVGFYTENSECHKSLLVSFIVNWGETKSLTTWNGYFKLDGSEKCISTTWLHTKSTKELRFWDGLNTGSNIFVPKK